MPSSASTTLKARPRIGLRSILGLRSPQNEVSSTSDVTVMTGLSAETTIGASYSAPSLVTTPRTWPSTLRIEATGWPTITPPPRAPRQAARKRIGDRAHAADRQAGRAAQRDQPRIGRTAALQ